MKILILTPLPSPFIAQPFEQLIKSYPNLELQAVFYGDVSHRPTWGDLDWEGTWLKGARIGRLRVLKALVLKFKPDQIILGQYNRIESWWLKHYAKKNNISTHILFLEPLIPSSFIKHKLKLELSRQFMKGTATVGCMGRRAFDEYSSLYKGHIFQCPYTFDLAALYKFDGSEKRKDCITFLYSGRLSAFRDPLLALHCFAAVASQTQSKVHLIISGRGELEADLKQEIQSLKLEALVTWMNDFKDWDDIRNLYRHADVLLSLGVYNTWSLTIQEAMAAGLGIIASHTTEAADALLVHDFNGYLTDHDNHDTIKQAMFEYVDCPEKIRLHGKRNREIVSVVDLNEVSGRIAKALNL